MYTVRLSPSAEKKLGKLEGGERKRLLRRIVELREFPAMHLDVKKMAGVQNAFRLRVGELRALFSLHAEDNEILVYDIGKRKNIY